MSLKISNQEISLQNLYYALQYVESIAVGARDKVGHTMRIIEQEKLDRSLFQKDLNKLTDIFKEHDDLSLAIELELDKRLKPILGNKYSTKTLLNHGRSIDDIIFKVRSELQAKEKKSKLDLT